MHAVTTAAYFAAVLTYSRKMLMKLVPAGFLQPVVNVIKLFFFITDTAD
jgi:hypothetical protein